MMGTPHGLARARQSRSLRPTGSSLDKGMWIMSDKTRVAVLSIDDVGKVRWSVEPSEHQLPDIKAVIEYFGLRPIG